MNVSPPTVTRRLTSTGTHHSIPGVRRRRRVGALFAVTTAMFCIPSNASADQHSNNLCVGTRPGCSATLQAALDASPDGDTIRLDRGTFAA